MTDMNDEANVSQATLKDSTRESHNDALSSLLMLAQANKSTSKEQELSASGNTPSENLKIVKRTSVESKAPVQPLARSITLEDLRKFFHLPIAEVARHFGTCTTALKKICRKLNITKWPYRQILSLTKSIQSLEMAVLNDAVASELRAQYRDQIIVLQKAIAEVMRNPSKAMETMNLSSLSTEGNDGENGRDEQEDDDFEKSEIDVQQIISAASAALTQTDRAPKKKSRIIKRKSFSDDDVENLDDLKQSDVNMKLSFKSHSLLPTAAQTEAIQVELSSDLIRPLSSIGLTVVQHNPFSENQKHQFVGQVILAPLQRKRFRPNINRKVVPLMEPDIGSNVLIEIIPNMIVNMLQKSLDAETSIGGDNGMSLLLPSMIQSSVDLQDSGDIC